MDLSQDITVYNAQGVSVTNQGTGMQVFIKTDFALNKMNDKIQIILFEEPENHLSHINLRKLIQKIISYGKYKQFFITTHNSLISTRLELKNLQILNPYKYNITTEIEEVANPNTRESKEKPTKLSDLKHDTAEYFLKAPPTGIIEFVLAPKVILVEGPSEYMLMDYFYKNTQSAKKESKNPEQDNVAIINLRGLSFLRYLEVAQKIGSKVAVITDNDGDITNNCKLKYKNFANENSIHIFYPDDENQSTFEYTIYDTNRDMCRELFGKKISNSLITDANAYPGYDPYRDPITKYMINNKTETALELLQKAESNDISIKVPNYIKEALSWIMKK